MAMRRPFETVDHEAPMQRHQPAPKYFEGDWRLGSDEIAERQLAAVQQRARRAYEVPFFRKRWDAAGFHPAHTKCHRTLYHASNAYF